MQTLGETKAINLEQSTGPVCDFHSTLAQADSDSLAKFSFNLPNSNSASTSCELLYKGIVLKTGERVDIKINKAHFLASKSHSSY